jgi:hypothetical protein
VRNRAPIRAVALTLLALLCGCAHDGDPLRYRLATSGTGIGTMSGVSGKSENYELCHPGADRGNRAPNRVTQLVVRTGPCGRVATETAKGGGADLTGWCLQSARRDGAASTRCNPKPTSFRAIAVTNDQMCRRLAQRRHPLRVRVVRRISPRRRVRVA